MKLFRHPFYGVFFSYILQFNISILKMGFVQLIQIAPTDPLHLRNPQLSES